MIIEQLQSTKFSEDESELAEITKNIINKIENKDTYEYFSKKDYEKLLVYYLNKNDKPSLKAMLSSTLIELLKTETGRIRIFEDNRAKQLKDIQFSLLVECIKKGKIENVKYLLDFSPYCKENLNKNLTLFEAGEMAPGASLLHLALKYGAVDIAKLLVDKRADHNAVDYYGNSALHYGGMGGKGTYDYAKQLGCSTSKNMFGHIPEDYLNKKDQLPVIAQHKFINQFIRYIRLNKYDENILMKTGKGENIKVSDLIKEINEGICAGESFIKAINIVRGQDISEIHEKMSKAIREWDGTIEGLDKPLDDPDLVKEFSNLRDVNLRAIFEYMMSIVLASQQYPAIPLLDIKSDDWVAMFELLRNKDDKLNRLDNLNSEIRSQDKFKQELERMLVKPNTIVYISVGDKKLHEFGHAIFLVTDESNSIFFIDANAPYKIATLKNDSDARDKITNIIFSYFNCVQTMTSYEYSNELNLKMQPK